MCASPCWTRWRVGTKRIESFRNIQWQQNTNPKKEYWMTTQIQIPTMIFFIIESASEDLPLQKLSPFAVHKGFQSIAGTLKSIKRLRDGSFLVECGKRTQAQNLLRTNRFIDRPVKVSVHKTLNSSRGVIRCRDLADMSEVEIRERSGCGWERPKLCSNCNGPHASIS